MMQGYQVSQALYVAATLGIADALAAGPKDVDELAELAGAHAPTLYRVLRLLASVGVFAEDDARHFTLTTLAECLRAGAPGSLRPWVLMVGAPSGWLSWGDLLATVRTGETAFPRVHGMDRWEHMARDPNESAVFNAAMTNNTELEASAIASRYDFSQFGVVADIGGGEGSLLATILKANPSLQGILFDLPQVVAAASGTLERAGVTDRCKTVGGSFFDAVPAGADAYVMKRVIHDWDDEQAIAILRSCRSVMVDGAKLLLVEQIVRPGNTPDPAKFTDLMMLVMQGGKERTADEFGRLLAAADFRLSDVTPMSGPFSVIEGVPV